MTVVVTVQVVGDMTRLRRYEAAEPRARRCTHEGFYDPETVTLPNVIAYMSHGPQQDRVRHIGCNDSGRCGRA